MRRFSFLRRYAPRFFATLALLGMIVYTVYHVIASSEDSLLTTPARQITDVQILTSDAYLFRDETVLTVPDAGLIQPIAQSGSKVGKDAPVTEVYSHDLASLEQAQDALDALNRYISVLESSIPQSGETLADAQKWKGEARESYQEILRAAQSGDLSTLTELEDSMLAHLNRYEALTAGNKENAELLNVLKQQRAQMLEGSAVSVRNARASGYFYDRAYVDGYEEMFSLSSLNDLTVSGFDALTASKPQSSAEQFAVGKMAYGYEWYIAIRLEAAFVERFEAGVRYRIVFSENNGKELILSCDRILREDGVAGAVAVFCCRDYPSDFSFLRTQKVKISMDYLNGYYVPDSALINLDGVDGVYIFENRTVRFRRVDILYRGDGYCIVAEKGDRSDDYLNLNDILITYGKNLYDGKVY